MKRDLFVIVNPAAGGGRAARQFSVAADYLRGRGRSVEFCESRNVDDLREQAARSAAAGYPYILGLGGDGTFHYLVEALAGTDAIAGFLPAGNGNDVARALAIPRDPVRAADAFLRSQPRAIDLIRVRFAGGQIAHCVCTAGVGLDAEAAQLANTRFRRWPGVARYLAGAARTYFRGAVFDLRAQIDGVDWHGFALLAVVANAPEYGAGIRIAPSAKLDDGWLDLVLVRPVTWTRFVEAIPVLLTSGDLRFQEVERFRCKRVRIEADRIMKVHGDGEILGESPVDFEIAPGAIRVMAPRTDLG
ncbi:MAG TPA: diacylglycerol kinase family protein [Candidatus Acidoferrales bacterium]|nr:diacylglycerol kinase family protein [Candidatus Acidoferrales bacterium]